MMILNFLLIAIVVVFIVDLSGFIKELEKSIAKLMNVKPDAVKIPKPFSCSLCMTFWICTIYLFIVGFRLDLFVEVILIAYNTSNIATLLRFIYDVFATINSILYKLLK